MALPRVSHPSGNVVRNHARWRRAKRTLSAEKAALKRWGDTDEIDYNNGEVHVVRRPITLYRLSFERNCSRNVLFDSERSSQTIKRYQQLQSD